MWQDGRLIHGTEYDWLICVNKGQLIFKPEDPEDPYDSTADFEYEKLEQWGWRITSPFTLSMPYLENDEIDKFFVVNMEVDGDYEQMVNIRPLTVFLTERDPYLLNQLLKDDIK